MGFETIVLGSQDSLSELLKLSPIGGAVLASVYLFLRFMGTEIRELRKSIDQLRDAVARSCKYRK